jgi:two-component system, OmpR family, sensor histidine kinase BaeS
VATTQDPVRAATEQAFLRRVNHALFIASAGAILLSLMLSVLLSRSLTRPVRDLTVATEALTKGELGHQVPVRSQDEFGALARSFNAMSQALAHAENLRKQMTADIAHELRTPLSLILGHAEALDEGVLPPTPETMHVIHDEARRLSRLVEDLRTLSLSDAGELPLAVRPMSVQELVERTTAAYRAQAQRRDIDLHAEITPDLPEVLADPDRIAQVLGNLLSNALHHTPDGGKITVSAQREKGDAVRLAVQDSGPGIVAEDLERVFERFYRTDRSRARDEGGSGLGLAIARSLVVAHGGRMWAENGACSGGAEQGATLLFTLPAHQEEEDA